MKVMTVVGTRPEIIRLSRVIPVLDRHVEHVLVHTGQNYDYELNQVFFEDLEIRKPDHFLGAAGRTAAETVGLVIAKVDELLASLRPDALLVLGDTNSCARALSREAPEDPHLPHGGRQPLLRPACPRGDQPQDRRPHQRREHAVQRHQPGVPPRRGACARSGHQDGQPDVRGAHALPAEDRRVEGSRPSEAGAGQVLRGQRPPRGEHRRAGAVREARRRAEPAREDVRPPRDRLHPPADAEADRGGEGHAGSARRAAEAARLQRLRSAAARREGGALRQRHHHRGEQSS